MSFSVARIVHQAQIDLDKKTSTGSNVDVDRNVWRADATKEATRSGKPVMATRPLSNGDIYSDRANSKGWTDQKEQLEKSLVVGKDLAYYRRTEKDGVPNPFDQ